MTTSSVLFSPLLSSQVMVTFRMKCAGMALPLASLRRPVSISWAISTFTSTLSPVMLARMRIGSAISTSASTNRYFDFLHRVEVLAVRCDERVDIRRLRHLDAGADEGVGAGWNLEIRGQGVRILLDQDGDGLRPRELALHRDRHDRAGHRGKRRGDLDCAARGRAAGAQR